MSVTKVKLGTRKSRLALWQTNHVMALLQNAWPSLKCETVPFVTQGDRTLDTPLPAIGGKGLFTQELEEALLHGDIDIAVHSLKDLPVRNPDGLTVGAIPRRGDVRDTLVTNGYSRLADLPHASVVGTSSMRRKAQVLALRPDLEVRSIRGNVDTRIRKVKEGLYDATILAGAGLARLNLEHEVAQWLVLEEMLPAPGQGALGIQCRADDWQTLQQLAALDHPPTRRAVAAERAFLEALGGGCSAPVAAHAVDDGGQVRMQGLVASLDGCHVIRVDGSAASGPELGARLAAQAIAKGAKELLTDG